MVEQMDRREYSAERRESVIRQLVKEDSFRKYSQLIKKEVELDQVIQDKIGFKKWNENVDIGFTITKNKLCVQLSVFNSSTCLFEVKDSIVYNTKVNLKDWALNGVWENYLKG